MTLIKKYSKFTSDELWRFCKFWVSYIGNEWDCDLSELIDDVVKAVKAMIVLGQLTKDFVNRIILHTLIVCKKWGKYHFSFKFWGTPARNFKCYPLSKYWKHKSLPPHKLTQRGQENKEEVQIALGTTIPSTSLGQACTCNICVYFSHIGLYSHMWCCMSLALEHW